ncbi:uncharacterized protein G6M90_00g098760 [Metarhizium brunneum]|uniref:Uncharacterized protein n=1 Tax=Metarhizium brunneum TaxID=500148 RepID=A0A7D5V239_9HYPO|nr:hypothetical protein G6M90_00g098760 [Metarhizium brunneum]
MSSAHELSPIILSFLPRDAQRRTENEEEVRERCDRSTPDRTKATPDQVLSSHTDHA